MTSSPSDAREAVWAAAMRAALAGDATAYRRLLADICRAIRPTIRGAFARARLGDGDIEDVVQETLLAIHLKRQTWDPAQKISPWIAAISRHKTIVAARVQKPMVVATAAASVAANTATMRMGLWEISSRLHSACPPGGELGRMPAGP